MRIDSARLGRLLLGGAFAGFVIFLVFNASAARDEEQLTRIATSHMMDIGAIMQALKDMEKRFTTPDPFGAFMFTGTFAAMVASVLVILDEMSTCLKRVLRKVLPAILYGIVIGGVIGVVIDFVGTRMARVSLLLFPVAQLLLFPLIGLAAGVAVGLTLGSRRRAMLAMVGGLVGGVLGGGALQTIGSMTSIVTGNGSIGRFFGFIIMGALIGLSVAFVEEVGKQSWVTVLNGPKEGRQYILSKPTTKIGRNELADIPLFGDMRVAKNHANLNLMGYLVSLQSVGGEVSVNGATVQSAQLQPRDTIRVGGHCLRFHQKWEQRVSAQVRYQPVGYQQAYAQQPQVPQAGYVPAQTMLHPVTSAGVLTLVAATGPHANQQYQFSPGTVQIGRETSCGVFLPMDTVISRTHAEITWNGAHWIIRDLNSRHGLWISGVRVTEHALNIGDQIGVGQSWLRVEGI